MTIISSVRQMVETPIYAINEGTSPILSYNYGARRPGRVRKAILTLALLILLYTAVMWSSIILAPRMLIGIFSSDAALVADAIPALKLYFAAFIFMDLQYIGQTVFKSLNKKKHAIFFSLLRKVFIVVPLTYPSSLCFGHGNRRCLCRRTGIKRHRWKSMLYNNVVYSAARIKADGKRSVARFLPAVFVITHTAFISYASSYSASSVSVSSIRSSRLSWLASSASTALCSSISFG